MSTCGGFAVDVQELIQLCQSGKADKDYIDQQLDDLRQKQQDNGCFNPVGLSGLVHLQDIGDVPLVNDQFAGTRGEARRLEGFQIEFNPPFPELTLHYMAHLQDTGDTAWVEGGEFVGTRGESRRLEGFAIELTGPAAKRYSVSYMAHLEGLGDTAFCSNGQFCGTRGQSRRVEGIQVHIELLETPGCASIP
jgi:uncharacterized protein YjdB